MRLIEAPDPLADRLTERLPDTSSKESFEHPSSLYVSRSEGLRTSLLRVTGHRQILLLDCLDICAYCCDVFVRHVRFEKIVEHSGVQSEALDLLLGGIFWQSDASLDDGFNAAS